MAGRIEWSEELSVNVSAFDNEHRKLIGYMNELYDAMKLGRGQDAAGKILTRLVDYTRTHFANEEKAFALHGFPNAGRHKLEHDQLIRQVGDFQQKLARGQAMLSIDLMTFLTNWLTHHICESDKQYSAFLNEKGMR